MNKEILKDISVLYVEDENDVREFTSKLLGSLLKKVYVAQNGLEGLELYKENQNDIDLLNHEYFESKFESFYKTDYRTAHNKTEESGRIWDPYKENN